ncbi:hypothetical protein [Mycobacteroides salmoniphilum]|uniref:Restriction endonuclease type IV Mrr domain-containing protein n=1 Tax=Mycobacteroides salmoniphilum TaxID=404941 RepID=A0A4R8SHA5_9MYCO|nr:hypothetical protein [Mycobacteroides salmoniphilum]TDZ96336.1 hypothetical protein CCUG60885_02480 [Mycobacteroides salmoniphilum]TEA05431.1 hypothetical protein CCUG60883_02737 [Mycobacteroides salmoniphilum]
MPVEAEEVQELGRQGVASVKRWLEATTFIELIWNVYENPTMCTMTCLGDNNRKKFDLVGNFIGNRRDPVAVECKQYTSMGSQHKYFKEFLAVAYSSTVRETADRGSDPKREYLWVTTHPFMVTEWTTLATEAKIRDALADNPKMLAGKEIDEEVLRKVSKRIWVLVRHDKQEEITLPNNELMLVLTALKRKEETL